MVNPSRWVSLEECLKIFENIKRTFLLRDMNVEVGGDDVRAVNGEYVMDLKEKHLRKE